MIQMMFIRMAIITIISTGTFHDRQDIIADIRNRYNSTKKSIDDNELFHDQLLINKENNPWPGSGNYQSAYDIYYRLKEVNEEMPRDKCVLLIQETTKVAAYSSINEYLFNREGKLIFYYNRGVDNPQSGKDYAEQRYYFYNDTLIRCVRDNTVLEENLDSQTDRNQVPNIQKNSQKIAAFFEGF
jgi:hypothetical protein